MKRKIFTFVAALAVTAGTVLPVSAAERTAKVPSQECNRPAWICQWMCRPCPEVNNPTTPDPEQTPSVPNMPEQNPSPELSISALEKAAAELVNDKREAYGLDPLTISTELTAKARIKAQDMKQNNYFSHTSPTYGSPFAMMQSLGISYRSAAENIAMGYRTAEAVVNAWMNSPSHRANILSSRYDTMGIGHTDGYWAQWFIAK